jgi:hypothetical protein
MDEPARWLRELAAAASVAERVRFLEEGVPMRF